MPKNRLKRVKTPKTIEYNGEIYKFKEFLSFFYAKDEHYTVVKIASYRGQYEDIVDYVLYPKVCRGIVLSPIVNTNYLETWKLHYELNRILSWRAEPAFIKGIKIDSKKQKKTIKSLSKQGIITYKYNGGS